MIQWHVIFAVFKRNFVSYFSNPIGYLFITAFVWASGYFAFSHEDAFFANNLANLDQLSTWFPALLLVFVPAITMTTWAEERRSGTEELLLTLPGSDLAIVLGKYLAALAIFTISLGFSLSHVIVLKYLGDPDLGQVFANFLGYWLAGAALVATGMVASMLTNNVTVAFILGCGLCAIPIMLPGFITTGSQMFSGIFSRAEGQALATGIFGLANAKNFGISGQLQEFANGVLPLGNVFYFLSIVGVMLYVNMVFLSRRHWGGSQQTVGLTFHYSVRTLCLAASVIAVTIMVNRSSLTQVDLTREQLHTLSKDTRKILGEIDPNRPVFIEAFISPKVPTDYIETRLNLLAHLRRYDAIAGGNLEVVIHDTEPYSENARNAERLYDIKAEEVIQRSESKQSASEVFLGLAVRSGLNQRTIPFMHLGLPIEYELTRLIRTVSQTGPKKKIGILNTDASWFGNFNAMTMQPPRSWVIVDELRQHFEVTQVSPESIPSDIKVLIVPMASSLTQPQLDKLLDYLRKGGPALIFDDPMPLINPSLAAMEAKSPQRNPMMGGQPMPEEKGKIKQLTALLNIEFDADKIIWQDWNPYPEFANLPPEYVFIGAGSGYANAFNADMAVSAGLKEALTMYSGSIRPGVGEGLDFKPLLQTGLNTGTIGWQEVFTSTLFGRALNPRPPRKMTQSRYTVAAHISGTFPGLKGDKNAPSANVIFIADLDIVSDNMFELRRRTQKFQFDNVNFVLNCIDYLAGDEEFLQLRKKHKQRPKLDRIRAMTEAATQNARKEEERAEKDAKDAIDKARKEMEEKIDELRNRKDVNQRQIAAELKNLETTLNRQLDVDIKEIESRRDRRRGEINATLQAEIRQKQEWIKWAALLLPPIPALLIGCMVFVIRRVRESEGVNPNRLVSSMRDVTWR